MWAGQEEQLSAVSITPHFLFCVTYVVDVQGLAQDFNCQFHKCSFSTFVHRIKIYTLYSVLQLIQDYACSSPRRNLCSSSPVKLLMVVLVCHVRTTSYFHWHGSQVRNTKRHLWLIPIFMHCLTTTLYKCHYQIQVKYLIQTGYKWDLTGLESHTA